MTTPKVVLAPAPNKQVPTQHTINLPKQNIIFYEVGKLASNLKYISTFYEQGNILEVYLKKLANTTYSEICHIPFNMQPGTQECVDSEKCLKS
jgi:hypothetical protein